MKRTLEIVICIWFLLFPQAHALAEERAIYAGDLIELKITTRAFSQEELREKFRDFEIVALEEKPDGYMLTLRTFEVGEKTIPLGDKEIVIAVQSALQEFHRTDVFEGSAAVLKPGFSPDTRIVAGIFALAFLSSGTVLLVRVLQKRKLARLTPLQRFLRAVGGVSLEDKDALVQYTFCLKEYLEAVFLHPVRGKTSDEILKELVPLEEVQQNLPEIRTWLQECDYLKFSGNAGNREKRQELLLALKALVEAIDAFRGGKT